MNFEISKISISDRQRVLEFLKKTGFLKFDEVIRIWENISSGLLDYLCLFLVENENIVEGIAGAFLDKDESSIVLNPFYFSKVKVGELLLDTVISHDKVVRSSYVTTLVPEDLTKEMFLQQTKWKLEDQLLKYYSPSVLSYDQIHLAGIRTVMFDKTNPVKLAMLFNHCFENLFNTRKVTHDDIKRFQNDPKIDRNNSIVLVNAKNEPIAFIMMLCSGEIDRLGVKDSYRRRSIAKFLLKNVVSNQKSNLTFALVLKSNLSSRNLFESLGFKSKIFCRYYRKLW